MREPVTPPTVVARVLEGATARPDRPALVAGGAVVSYGDLRQRILAAAGELRRSGVSTGDRVVLAATSGAPFIYGYLATHLVGGICVPLDPEMPESRQREILSRVRPRLTFEARSGSGVAAASRPLDALASAPACDERFPGPGADDVADLLFTTGTGGRPKGVVLTHRNVLAAVEQTNAVIGNGPDDREVVPLPLSHSFGLGRVRCNLVAGGMVIPVPGGFRLPGEIFGAIERWDATGLVGVPAGIAVLLRVGEAELSTHADRLRYMEIGSAPMAAEQKRRLMAALPRTRIWMHYGLTEASRSAFLEFHSSADRLDSIGRPAPGIEIRILDDDGNEVPDGEPGRLAVRGATVMRGYWDDAERTAAVLRDGWLHTGDSGFRGPDSLLHFRGRDDDIINSGGFKIVPLEIERVLDACDGVAASACIGVPDPQGILGQVVHAFLEPAPGAARRPSDEELAARVRERVERYKVPVAWHWIPSLPRTASGKIQYGVLRRQFQEEVERHDDR